MSITKSDLHLFVPLPILIMKTWKLGCTVHLEYTVYQRYRYAYMLMREGGFTIYKYYILLPRYFLSYAYTDSHSFEIWNKLQIRTLSLVYVHSSTSRLPSLPVPTTVLWLWHLNPLTKLDTVLSQSFSSTNFRIKIHHWSYIFYNWI